MIRKLILLAFLLGLAQSAWAVPALVRRCPDGANGITGGFVAATTTTCTFASNAAGNMLFIWAQHDKNSQTLTISDGAVNTWTTVLADSTAGGNSLGTTHIWVAYNSNVSAGNNIVTVTAGAASTASFYIGGAEYSGLATASALDQTLSADAGSVTNPSSGNVTTTVASELATGTFACGNGTVTFTAGTNVAWVTQGSTINGNRSPAWEDFILSSTQTLSANGTYSAAPGAPCRVTISTFKVPGAAGGGASKKKKVIFY